MQGIGYRAVARRAKAGRVAGMCVICPSSFTCLAAFATLCPPRGEGQPGAPMDLATFAVQLLNGVQYGLVLFLVASGLTLVFGILGVINLAHGAFYMLGAYVAYWLTLQTGSFLV